MCLRCHGTRKGDEPLINTVNLFDLQVANADMNEVCEYISELIELRQPCYIGGLNMHQIMLIDKDKKLREIYENAGMIFPDGQPVIYMAKDLGTPLKQKLSGPDLMDGACKMAAEKGYRVFFLGGKESSPEKAAKKFSKKYPGLCVAGSFSPPFGFEKDEEQMDKLISMLKDSNADMLFVGLGSPKQDYFIADNMGAFKIPVSFSIGIAIDFHAGAIKRAPVWMQKCGLEWLHRMVQDPKRLIKRYFIEDQIAIRKYFEFKKKVRHISNGQKR